MILRTTCYMLGLLLLLGHRMVAADDDYADEGAGAAGSQGSSNDFYEPAQLEQEVGLEAQKQRNSLEDNAVGAMAARPDNSLSMEQSPTTAKPKEAGELPTSAEREDENTAAEEMEELPGQRQKAKAGLAEKHSQEYYYEMQDEEEQAETERTATPKATPTTSIPDYVRKAKADRFPPVKNKGKVPAEHDDSDYVEDDVEQQTPAPEKGSAELYNQSMQLDEQQQPTPQAQVQQQQLPARHRSKPFQAANSDEYYYDEQPESGEGKPTTVRTTTTTTTPKVMTTTPSTTTASTPVLQAGFGFSWTSTVGPIPTTTVASTTPTPLATAATTPRKQPKHIQHLSKPELLPADQLRNYIKDVYIRMPLAVIVDPSASSLDKAKRLYNDALKDKDINIKIVLVTLNAAGAPSAFSFNNTREFIAGLNSTKEHDGGDAFVGVLHAAELVPYDSAVFISTAAIPPHTELVQDAAITLLKKRIRLFLLWFGERAASENETEEAVAGILGEVAIRSGGEIIHIVSTEHGQHIAGNTLTLVADSFQGTQELELPVDTTLASLHVKIDAHMRRATLETPNGEINLKKLVKFKPPVLIVNGTSIDDTDKLDAYVPLNKLRKSTTFTLKLSPELPTKEFNVFIRAERKADVFLGDIIKRFDSYYLDGPNPYPTRFSNNRSLGELARARMATKTHAKLKFPEEPKETNGTDRGSPKTEVETFSDTVVHREAIPSMNQTQLAAATAGYGTEQRSSLNGMLMQRCGIKIELSTRSQLLVTAGQMSQLIYEVTNMRAERVYQNVQVTDERRFLVQLTPSSFYLGPREMTTVRLTVLVPAGTAQGTSDRIHFTSYGRETATQAVNLKVVSNIDAQDTTAPSLSWEFGNRCDYVAADALNCGERFWTLDITAQDWQSGMLRLQTTPTEGLFYRNYYTAGSTEPLKATYMASCCEPKMTIAAHDASGNIRTINIDVRDIVLTDAAIAAIVLGCVLLLLLIVLLIVSIVWCCRRRKMSLELPTYRSHSTRSME